MAAEEESCSWYEFGCRAGEFVGNVADSAMADFIESIHSAAVKLMELVGTWWMTLEGPDFDSDAVSGLQGNLSYFVWVFGLLGFLVGVGKLAITQDPRNTAISIGGQIFRMIIAGGVYMTAIPLLLDAGDATSVWLLEQAHGDEAEASFSSLMGSSAVLMSLSGAAFLIYLLLFLGALVNFVFMLFRNVMFLLLSVFIVVLAASSGTEAGQQAWRKANGWLLALLLFKPVAAAIYALGFRLMNQTSTTEGTDEMVDAMVSSLTGLLILVLASLALPALIKFVVPAAAAGSGAFSGGAALGATAGVAAGAAVVAATGGAGAAGAATAGGSGASSGGAGAATAGESGSGATTSGASSVGGGESQASDSADTASSASDSSSATNSGGGASNVIDGRSEGSSEIEGTPVVTSMPDSANEGTSLEASSAAGGSVSDSQNAPPERASSHGGKQPNWSGAAQAHNAAKGAVTPSNNDGDDDA